MSAWEILGRASVMLAGFGLMLLAGGSSNNAEAAKGCVVFLAGCVLFVLALAL